MAVANSSIFSKNDLGIQAQAGATPAEMTYEAAMESIAATKGEISGLTGEIAVQEARLTRQQAALARVAAEAERLNDALQGYQAGLQAAQQAQTLVNQGLELAYSWFLQDRQAMLELGGEAATQVAIMDGKARELLGGVSAFASDTTTIASETLAGMIATFESSSAEAVIAVNLELAKIPRDIYTYHHIVRVYDGGSSGPSPTQPTPIQGRASGGPVYAGQAYIVGEEGPELFVPRVSGTIRTSESSRTAVAAAPVSPGRLTIDRKSATVKKAAQTITGRVPKSDGIRKVTYKVYSEVDEGLLSFEGEAKVKNGEYSAEGLKLKPNANKIVVTATYADGSKDEQSITLNYDSSFIKDPKAKNIAKAGGKGGPKYVNNNLLVFFEEGVDDERRQEIIDTVSGECAGYINGANMWQVEVKPASITALRKLAEKLSAMEGVFYAGPNMAGAAKAGNTVFLCATSCHMKSAGMFSTMGRFSTRAR